MTAAFYTTSHTSYVVKTLMLPSLQIKVTYSIFCRVHSSTCFSLMHAYFIFQQGCNSRSVLLVHIFNNSLYPTATQQHIWLHKVCPARCKLMLILENMKLSIQNYKYFEPALLVYKPSLISERFCVPTAQAFSGEYGEYTI